MAATGVAAAWRQWLLCGQQAGQYEQHTSWMSFWRIFETTKNFQSRSSHTINMNTIIFATLLALAA